MKHYIFLLFILFSNILHSTVIVEGKINKKIIYKWQNIEYTLEFIGDAGTFKVEGLNENAISDFEVINKRVESELTDIENESPISKYKIFYTLKPIGKGKLKIPEIEARYYEIRNDDNYIANLVPHEEILEEYQIRVFSYPFLIITIAECLIVFLIIFFVYRAIKYQRNLKL